MADYFPLISRAVAALPNRGTPEQRHAIYDRARDALGRQLRAAEPPLADTHVERERHQLEEAVLRLEAELAQQAADAYNPLVDPPARSAPAANMRLQAPPDLPSEPPAQTNGSRRPRVPFAGEEPVRPRRRNYVGMTLAAGLPIMIGLGVAAYILRDNPDSLAKLSRSANAAQSAVITASKSPAAGEDTRPAVVATPTETVVPVAVRASFFEESLTNPQQRIERRGAVVWRVEPDTVEQGAPSLPRIKGEIEIPDLKLQIEFIIRRNTDTTFPASHTLNLKFIPLGELAPTIKSISLPEFRDDPLQKGPILQGGNVPVQDNEFLVALLNGEPVQSTNIDLLNRTGWLSFELRFADGRRGELVFEKGVAGERAFDDAFRAWGQ